MKHQIYAIIAEEHGEKYIVGVAIPPNYEMTACVSSKRENVEKLWDFVHPETRNVARIAKFEEVK